MPFVAFSRAETAIRLPLEDVIRLGCDGLQDDIASLRPPVTDDRGKQTRLAGAWHALYRDPLPPIHSRPPALISLARLAWPSHSRIALGIASTRVYQSLSVGIRIGQRAISSNVNNRRSIRFAIFVCR